MDTVASLSVRRSHPATVGNRGDLISDANIYDLDARDWESAGVRALADVIIPVRNEALTIAGVVRAALSAETTRRVLVIANGSVDGSARIAESAGAEILVLDAADKTAAIFAGAAVAESEVLCTLDGDLIGLTADHIDSIVKPVLHDPTLVTAGLFPNLRNDLAVQYPPLWWFSLAGQRVFHRGLLSDLQLPERGGFFFEASMNMAVSRRGGRVRCLPLDGVEHVKRHRKVASGRRADKSLMIAVSYGYYARLLVSPLRGLR